MMMVMIIIMMIRSMAATVPEQSQLLGPGLVSADLEPQEVETALAWSRLPGQACKIPTSLLSTVESGAR